MTIVRMEAEQGLVGGALREDVFEFPQLERQDGGVSYTPFVARDGRVGYAVRDRASARSEGREDFIYLNPSNTEDTGSPDVFLYQGGESDPALDAPLHFYRTAEGWDAEESEEAS